MVPRSSKVTTFSVVIDRRMADGAPFQIYMVITALVPHTITSFTTFLQSCNCAAFASDLKCRCDLVQNELIWHIGGTEANKHTASSCRYLLTNYNQLTVGTHKYVKDSIDGRNAKQMLRFGSAGKNMQF